MQSLPLTNDAIATKDVIAESIDDTAYRNLDMRGTQAPIPSNLDYYLNAPQLHTLHNLESSGWSLLFVRRPLFESPMVVVQSPGAQTFAAIELDGTLDLEPPMLLRV